MDPTINPLPLVSSPITENKEQENELQAFFRTFEQKNKTQSPPYDVDAGPYYTTHTVLLNERTVSPEDLKEIFTSMKSPESQRLLIDALLNAKQVRSPARQSCYYTDIIVDVILALPIDEATTSELWSKLETSNKGCMSLKKLLACIQKGNEKYKKNGLQDGMKYAFKAFSSRNKITMGNMQGKLFEAILSSGERFTEGFLKDICRLLSIEDAAELSESSDHMTNSILKEHLNNFSASDLSVLKSLSIQSAPVDDPKDHIRNGAQLILDMGRYSKTKRALKA